MKGKLKMAVIVGNTFKSSFGGHTIYTPFPYNLDKCNLVNIIQIKEAEFELPEAKFMKEDSIPEEITIGKFQIIGEFCK